MQAQEFTATELLNKSIAYHDPQGVWERFEGSFFVTMESPNRPIRKSKIELDFMESFFRLTVESEENELVSVLKDEECDLFADFQVHIVDLDIAAQRAVRIFCDIFLPIKYIFCSVVTVVHDHAVDAAGGVGPGLLQIL